MGINDRDYMKKEDDVINVGQLFVVFLKVVVVLVAVFFSFRFPLLWIKIPLAIGILVFGWRWISKPAKKKPVIESEPEPERPMRSVSGKVVSKRQRHIEKLKAEAGNPPQPNEKAIRLLIAYDAAGEFGQAKALIQHFDGKEFPELVVEEFTVLARNYFPIELEPTKTGVLFKLA